MALIIITVVSLVVAAVMSVVAWRLTRDERRRSEARVSALAADIHGEGASPVHVSDSFFAEERSRTPGSPFRALAIGVLVVGRLPSRWSCSRAARPAVRSRPRRRPPQRRSIRSLGRRKPGRSAGARDTRARTRRRSPHRSRRCPLSGRDRRGEPRRHRFRVQPRRRHCGERTGAGHRYTTGGGWRRIDLRRHRARRARRRAVSRRLQEQRTHHRASRSARPRRDVPNCHDTETLASRRRSLRLRWPSPRLAPNRTPGARRTTRRRSGSRAASS